MVDNPNIQTSITLNMMAYMSISMQVTDFQCLKIKILAEALLRSKWSFSSVKEMPGARALCI